MTLVNRKVLALLFVIVAAPVQADDIKDVESAIESDLRARFSDGARYVIGRDTPENPHQNCVPVTVELKENSLLRAYTEIFGSPNAKLLECTYNSGDGSGRKGWAIVVAATTKNLAARVVRACAAVKAKSLKKCSQTLISASDDRSAWRSNSFIFPITGFVFEDVENCKNGSGRGGFLGFRHGVTIQYAKGEIRTEKFSYCSDILPISDQRKIGLTHTTWEVFDVARIAAIRRDKEKFPKTKLSGLDVDSFQRLVRQNEINAILTGNDDLMKLKARDFVN